MISRQELQKVGRLLKPHGINGEIVALLTEEVDLSEMSCIVLDIDGIYVPFFLSSIRQKSSETDLLTIDGIGDETAAAGLCGRDLYVKLDECNQIPVNRMGSMPMTLWAMKHMRMAFF